MNDSNARVTTPGGSRRGIVGAILLLLVLSAATYMVLKAVERDSVAVADSASSHIESTASPLNGSDADNRAIENLPADFHSVPDSTLTERSGRRIKLSDLKGNVWVANFIFTRCAGPCPMMTRKMKELQEAFVKAPNVKLVSFSVDPVYDTPQVLAEYAHEFNADADRWLFLTTGSKQSIWDLGMKGFKLAVGEEALLDGRATIFHDERFVVVDANGAIRGYFDSKDREWRQRVLKRVGVLLRESSEGL